MIMTDKKEMPELSIGHKYKNALGSVFTVLKICGNGRVKCAAEHKGTVIFFKRSQLIGWIEV